MEESLSSYELFKSLNTSDIYNNISRPLILADDIRTPENMGAILRLAANIGASEVLFISGKKEHFKNYKISKTASGADKKIKWKIVENIKTALLDIPCDYSIVAIETSPNSQNIFENELPEKICFVIGNEVKGIRNELLEKADNVVHIPIPGQISSLNVTHALSVSLFEWYRQMTMNNLSLNT